MRDDVSVEDCPNITFQKSELPSTTNITVAKTVCVGQHVTVKAKVASLTEVKKDNSGRFNMVHVVLVDTSSSIKLILWESIVKSVVAGSTYLFHNLTVRKVKFTNEVYLNTAQSGTAINITDTFQEMLAATSQAPAIYLTTTETGEIIGVNLVWWAELCDGFEQVVKRITRVAFLPVVLVEVAWKFALHCPRDWDIVYLSKMAERNVQAAVA